MAGPLKTLDWLVILALAIVVIALIFIFAPLIILILAIAGAYLVYKWYRAGRPIKPT